MLSGGLLAVCMTDGRTRTFFSVQGNKHAGKKLVGFSAHDVSGLENTYLGLAAHALGLRNCLKEGWHLSHAHSTMQFGALADDGVVQQQKSEISDHLKLTAWMSSGFTES